MNRPPIDQALPVGDRILLDASTLIAYLDGGERVSPLATHIIDEFVQSGRNPAVVSMVTIMELLVRPLRRGPGDQYRHAVDFLTRFPNLHPAVIDIAVAQEAASLRATFRLAAPDALAIATGVVSQVGHLVTNDEQWRQKLRPIGQRIAVCYLSDHLPFP